ncbi:MULTISPECIES: MFS transporter [Streptomycetaceae]|uniref:Transmembrane efflux protein n=1 Tax=Streptantibioticus cattleyicolor (strain ATCC 35852 / DSM 46488 / JCM 4925 / NBRC 14057 / NRRL 8057) TaxID=1003195 RepID=F8JUL4_STREN|nr:MULTISPECIES: MFS transporter [Streptomycetaceae]AEW95643.1 transmembrane efflux protein [Streptantibioticus cattleyicolor NRRL 8057 = DSM 46488]MYS60188.1 MFS transporter [Streptomyces sp. SID5468]CCB75978.1 Putative drug resistance transporter [Streptantibioticus cattleyicolor NRRL 8057 = DSM 46488]
MSEPAAATTVDVGGAAATAAARHRWLVLAVIGLAQLMVILDSTIVNIALPSAQRSLGFSTGSRQWIVTAYALAFGSLLLIGGRVGDLFGRKATFVIGLAGFGLASAAGGAAGGFDTLVTARALQGVFGALVAPSCLALLNTTFTDPRERGKAFGVYGAISGTGAAVGLLLGGLLTEYLSWRWCLYVNLVIAVPTLLGTALFIRGNERAAGRARLDLPGSLLVSAALFCLVYGFANAQSHSWSTPLTWGALLAGGVLLAVFAAWQTRAANPVLPLRILLDRDRGASFIALLISGAGLFGVSLFLTFYLQQNLAYSPVQAGLAFLPMNGGIMISAIGVGNALLPRLGPRVLVPAGMAVAAAGLALLTPLDAGSSYPLHILPPLFVMGLGIGLIFAPAMSLGTAGVAPQDAGAASASINVMQQVGGSLGIAVLSTLAASATAARLSGHRPTPALVADAALHGYATAYWWAAGFFAVGVVVTAALYRGRTATG